MTGPQRILDRALRLAALTALVGLVGLAETATAPREADACGGFFMRGAQPPSLRVERVLILHDAEKEVEHFVRELTFRDAPTAFGFVVPTPSKPEVAAVDLSPFLGLFDRFPLDRIAPSRGEGGGGPPVGSKGGARTGSSVTVHSEQRIGSFTAFVLSATNPADMKTWLDKNKFDTTPQSAEWLAHFVDLGYFFTAFRYEPKGKAEETGVPEVRGETVRISFPTPLPYYPYLEPDRQDATNGIVGSHRILALWLISQQRSIPIAAVTEGGHTWWKQPWREGATYTRRGRTTFEDLLGASLEPLLPGGSPETTAERTEREALKPTDWPHLMSAGDVVDRPDVAAPTRLNVQVFEDQKVSRKGWGDVVFVPDTPQELDAAAIEKRRPLLRALDPMIGGSK